MPGTRFCDKPLLNAIQSRLPAMVVITYIWPTTSIICGIWSPPLSSSSNADKIPAATTNSPGRSESDQFPRQLLEMQLLTSGKSFPIFLNNSTRSTQVLTNQQLAGCLVVGERWQPILRWSDRNRVIHRCQLCCASCAVLFHSHKSPLTLTFLRLPRTATIECMLRGSHPHHVTCRPERCSNIGWMTVTLPPWCKTRSIYLALHGCYPIPKSLCPPLDNKRSDATYALHTGGGMSIARIYRTILSSNHPWTLSSEWRVSLAAGAQQLMVAQCISSRQIYASHASAHLINQSIMVVLAIAVHERYRPPPLHTHSRIPRHGK